jgi:thiosulfate/3-mercaptopyruvate sulfurtransferase
MVYKTLISVQDLNQHLNDPDWVVIDCRFVLSAIERGEKNYQKSHIPGAIYAHLERDLSDEIVPGVTGRHPWPTIEQAVQFLSRAGIDEKVQVVVYDDAGGALAAGRLWWILRWLGHEAVAVLDGGWQAWVFADLPIQSEIVPKLARVFQPKPRPEIMVNVEEVDAIRQDPAFLLLDARAADRFHGQNETIDPVAGHIPGAVNAPYGHNLTQDNLMKSPEELRQLYSPIVGDTPIENITIYCGSGVTSIHNTLAMLHAGFGEARIYPGSWSEWITDPTRPIAT